MYHGFIGPYPILHWIINSDGEGSYDLTHYEMLIHISIIYFVVLEVHRSIKVALSRAS